jgi:hypothetical protein
MSVIVTEDFLADFGALESFQGEFESVKNHDGAVYPAVCQEIPREVKLELYRAIVNTVGFDITPRCTLLRRFEEGSVEPYQAHTDLNMGQFTCIVYKQGIGGTSFVKHKETGMLTNDEQFADEWDRDKNKYEAWEVYYFEQLKPNKSVIYNASLMHRGEPVAGHGVGDEARELLICFFDMSDLQRSQDPDEIMQVLTHPAIWEAIGGAEEGGFELTMSEDYHYLHADGAIFILHPEGDDWMLHVNIIPEARGKAYELTQEAFRYAFEYLGANKLVAEVPVEYESVYHFGLKNGMRQESLIDGVHYMGLEYEKWAS